MDEKVVLSEDAASRKFCETGSRSPSPPPLTEFDRADTSRSGRSRRSGRSQFSSAPRRAKGQPVPWPDPYKYEARSLFCLRLQNPIRQGLIFAIENPWWDRIVLFIILINTVSLIARDPYDVEQFQPESTVRIAWETMSTIFNIFFLIECICKVMALGLVIGSRTYLSTAWNWLDIVVVIIGTIELLPTGSSAGNLSALRSFRVLRPLRVITKVKDLRFLVTVILKSVPELRDVFSLCLFVWFVFGIIGVQLFQGATRGACYDMDTGANTGTAPCSPLRLSSDDPIQDQILCPMTQECLRLFTPPNGGVTNFDNILAAFINIFQVMTQQGWTDIMYALQASLSFHVWIYFVVLNFVGPYFVIQLFLVVISKKYAELKAAEAATALALKQLVKDSAPAVTSSNRVHPEPNTPAQKPEGLDGHSYDGIDGAPPPPPSSAEALGPEEFEGRGATPVPGAGPQSPEDGSNAAPYGGGGAHLPTGAAAGGIAEVQVRSIGRPRGSGGWAQGLFASLPAVMKAGNLRRGWVHIFQNTPLEPVLQRMKPVFEPVDRFLRRVRGRFQVIAASGGLEYLVMAAITVNTLLMAIDADCEFCAQSTCALEKGVLELSNLAFTSIFSLESLVKLIGFGPTRYIWIMAPMSWLDIGIVVSSLIEIPSVMTTSACYLTVQPCADFDECEASGGTSVLRIVRLARIVKLLSRFTSLQKQIKAIVKTAKSVSSLVLLIMIFVAIFVILGMNLMPGMILQPWSSTNLMRGMQVFVVVPGDDLVKTPFPSAGRIATLQNHDSLNHSSRPWNFCFDYATPSVLASAGFDGCLWADIVDSAGLNTPAIVGVMERDNFDSAGVAFLTALGILTTSNWNSQYYNAAVDFGPGIIFYYIAWILIGNWVLFNMFVAILIQGISEEKKNKFRRQEELVAEGIKEIFFGLTEEELVYKVEVLFKEADNDNSGHIDMNELEGILVNYCKVDMGPRELVRLFRKYDDDDSGKINLEEFENMIKELLQISKDTLKKLLLKTIKEIFGSLPEDGLKAKTLEMFHKADKDGSGLIDESELQELLSEYDIELMPTDLTRLLSKFGDHGGDRISEQGFTLMIKQLLEEARHDGQTGVRESRARAPRASFVADFAAAVITGKRTQTAPAPPLAEYDDPPTWSHEEPRKKDDTVPKGDLNMMATKERLDAELSGLQEQERPVSIKTSESEETPVEPDEDKNRNENHDTNGGITGQAGPATNNAAISVTEEVSLGRAKRSLFIFSLTNPFRRNCIRILEYPPNAPGSGKHFDNFILLCIVLSSCSLAFEHPRIGTGSSERISLDRLNIFLNLAFLCECCLKIVADSFAGYLKSGWSRLDFFIVVTSTVDMTMTYLITGQNVSLLKTFRILRILRALRPLRLIARARSLRLLISALWSSIVPILGTCSIALLAYAMCALLGMQLLRGKMKSCSDPRFISKKECLEHFDESGAHLQWLSYPVNWDNLYNGIVAMFILSSQDNWQVYMWAGTDAVSRIEGPRANQSLYIALFYVFCLLVSSFLVINLVISVFVDAYYTASEKMQLSDGKDIEPRAKFLPLHGDVTGENRLAVFSVVTANSFDMFIAFFIVTNIVTMAFESFKQSSWQSEFGLSANFFYSLVFGWECMFKLFAFCPRRYYQGAWNRFDFFIVTVSFGGILIDGLGTSVPMDPRTLRVLRLFRVFRILRAFRILKSAKGLTRILGTLVKSLPALRNLMMLLALVFFIFAVLGVSMFGGLCVAGEEAAPGLEAVRCFFSEQGPPLDPKINFRDVGHALIALFRVSTTDAWSALMFSMLVSPVRNTISTSTWVKFQNMNGSETPEDFLGPPQDIDYMSVVKRSLSGWKNSVIVNDTFISEIDGWPGTWPYPNTNASDWANIAKSILLNCITDEEAAALEAAGLMNCSVLGQERPCASTCTDFITGTLFFAIFTLMSAFVLMQLVIAVLLQQLLNTSDKAESSLRTPGCEKLRLNVFGRMQRRWRFSALQKLKLESALRHRRQAMESPPLINDIA